MRDTLAHLHGLAQFNGRAAAMGFCYGGPYAILGPKRLGYAAGISCHGTQMLDIHELEGTTEPICVLWGDRDHRAPAEVLDAYRAAASQQRNLELHVFPGVQHGYMMPAMPKAFDRQAREFSMQRAFAILDGLRSRPVQQGLRQAS
jgi:carboxymethylenebutenolidase